MALIDLTKAFDCVDHGIIIVNKLEFYGIRGLPLKLFESYLKKQNTKSSVTQHRIVISQQ